MSVVELAATEAAAPVDPFTLPPGAPAPRRPRILSYVGRWGRARRWLSDDALRVLDIGCSFGYGAAAIQAGRPDGRSSSASSATPSTSVARTSASPGSPCSRATRRSCRCPTGWPTR